MALDALAIRALVKEIDDCVTGGRIDKIHQPERDEILLHIRTFTAAYKLVLSASSANPRLHFTDTSKVNPVTPPMFCMLMRKHLGSGKITGVHQIGFERIVQLDVESYDELGDLTTKHLIIEIMGRHSNIVLTHEDMKIIDCIKHVDLTVSSVRQVLPGMQYEFPPEQDKLPLPQITADTFPELELSREGTAVHKALLGAVSGISPLTAREIVYRAYQNSELRGDEVSDLTPLKAAAEKLAKQASNGVFEPCLITEVQSGRMIDFSAISIEQYGSVAHVEVFDSMNRLVDRFYSSRDTVERMKQKSSDLVKLLTMHLERAGKKAAILMQTLKDAENKEEYKIFGDLITGNLYKIKEGDRSVLADNYYEPDCPQILIKLDPALSPSDNAQRYYKKYRKAKTAEVEAAHQSEQNQAALDYLESTLVAVENARSESDLNAIRRELAEQGYLKRLVLKKGNRKPPEQKPMHFISSDGFDIYVGKNNTQNDYLTLRFANSSDWWFHTKNIHGSHAIIKLGIDKEVPERTMREAAELAAYYSKGRSSAQVPVDYTRIRNVKKPNGAKPGMVIYEGYNTVYVTPRVPVEEQ